MRVPSLLFPISALALTLTVGPVGMRADDAVEKAAERIESRAEDFSDRLDQELDKLVIDGQQEEDQLEALAEQFRAQLGEVYDEVKDDDQREWAKEYERTLGVARRINEAMYQYAFSPALREMWRDIRSDLNELAGYYGTTIIIVR